MAIRYRKTRSEDRALEAFVKFMRAADSVAALLDRGIAAEGVTRGQFGVLEALLHVGPMSQNELGEKLLRSGGNITTVIDNLERDRLVRRERNQNDRRVVTVHLTPAGRRFIQRIFPGHVERVVTALSALTVAEQRELGRLCRKLGLSARAEFLGQNVEEMTRRLAG